MTYFVPACSVCKFALDRISMEHVHDGGGDGGGSGGDGGVQEGRVRKAYPDPLDVPRAVPGASGQMF